MKNMVLMIIPKTVAVGVANPIMVRDAFGWMLMNHDTGRRTRKVCDIPCIITNDV